MLPVAQDISVHSIIVSIVNGAAVGLGINISMLAFFSVVRKLITWYTTYRDRNKITNVQN